MKFVWEINEANYYNYKNLVEENIKLFGEANSTGILGMCRVGDLCFDIRAWGDDESYGIGYELYVGNVDTGYNTTTSGIPYDLVEEYDEFPAEVLDMSLEDFKKMAEPVFEKFIYKVVPNYTVADLLAKANEETNYML